MISIMMYQLINQGPDQPYKWISWLWRPIHFQLWCISNVTDIHGTIYFTRLDKQKRNNRCHAHEWFKNVVEIILLAEYKCCVKFDYSLTIVELSIINLIWFISVYLNGLYVAITCWSKQCENNIHFVIQYSMFWTVIYHPEL